MKKSDERIDKKATPSQENTPQDVVLVQGVTEDRKGLRVLRARDQKIEAGEVRPLKEGQAITSDVVKLHPRKGAPFLCDVETTYTPARPAKGRSEASDTGPSHALGSREMRPTTNGPAQVASQTYRDNWDAIWMKRSLDKGSSELN